jgi:PAS domain-containing protein
MALDLALALQTAQIGVWELDVTTGQMTWSVAARDLLSLPDREANLESLMQRIHPRDQDEVRYAMMRAVFERSHLTTRFRIVARPDTDTLVELRAHTVRGTAGEPECVVGVCIEVASLSAAA